MAGAIGLLSAVELKQRFDRGDELAVLDVREAHERLCAVIPLPAGVVDLHIPLGEVAIRLEEIEVAIEGLPLVIYCHHGQRSMVAARWLARRGLGEIMNLEGGIDAWSTRVDRGVRRY
jgi:rhodanese-related sulfurtransferase